MRLAELKRIPVGTRLNLVHCLLGPVPEGRSLRRAARVKSNAIVFEILEGPKAGTESWLYFPRASEFKTTPKGFEIYEGSEVAARYEWA